MSDGSSTITAAEPGIRSRKLGATPTNGADALEVQIPPRTTTAAPAAAAPSSSSSSAASVKPKKKHAGPIGSEWGFTAAGDRFHVPDTLNTAEVFLPGNLSLGSAFSMLCIVTAAGLTFFGGYGKWLNIAIFLFWRTSYDLGLGLILRAQSERHTFLKLYLRLYAQGGWKAQLLDHLAVRQLAPEERAAASIQSFPQEFRAWLVYKNFVNIILVNDGLTYLLLGLKCWNMPDSFTLLVLGQYLVGIFLGIFNYWAKVDAHRCIGEYWSEQRSTRQGAQQSKCVALAHLLFYFSSLFVLCV